MSDSIQTLSHESQPHGAEIQAHAVHLLYQRLGGVQVHLFLMPIIIAYAFWDHLNQVMVAAWALAICGVYGARMVLFFFLQAHQSRHFPGAALGHLLYGYSGNIGSGLGCGRHPVFHA